MGLQRIDELTSPPLLGRFYLVPTVRYRYLDLVSSWPVCGPRHDDAEHLDFPYTHYHFDRRFLTSRQWAVQQPERADIHFASRPLSQVPEYGNLPEPVYLRRRCQRAEVGFPTGHILGIEREHPIRSIFSNFHRAFSGRRCGRNAVGQLVCPHKGFILGSLQPDLLGHVVCPLHGRRIDIASGTVVSDVGSIEVRP